MSEKFEKGEVVYVHGVDQYLSPPEPIIGYYIVHHLSHFTNARDTYILNPYSDSSSLFGINKVHYSSMRKVNEFEQIMLSIK